jgi:transcriptional regulator with XRE-family HTH domain
VYVTDFRTEKDIGRRIKALRRQRGLLTARDLADAIPLDALSESVIQNIEAGRKAELSVSQLLNIAAALRVPPVVLLAPIGLPLHGPDVPNLSSDIAGMTTVEFDAWLSGASDGAYRWKPKTNALDMVPFAKPRPFNAQERECLDWYVAFQFCPGMRVRRSMELIADYGTKLLNQKHTPRRDGVKGAPLSVSSRCGTPCASTPFRTTVKAPSVVSPHATWEAMA